MQDTNDRSWSYTRRVIEQHEQPLTGDEDHEGGNRLLRELAAASEGRLEQIAPGVWVESKL